MSWKNAWGHLTSHQAGRMVPDVLIFYTGNLADSKYVLESAGAPQREG
jgi:hypothetical protein